ncbi:MAG: hypothetical protein CVU48_10430 [Candidatus Cloacimonetes bacterium HGW-Cloacimonetes-1]|jgi:tetratricopeptide (TPR) repeat protein|nr:MAG: hypothetical protein CVU48_10430 [Candidatus Cloacimonetes bacterium HGW-Cloacimonetes-1]
MKKLMMLIVLFMACNWLMSQSIVSKSAPVPGMDYRNEIQKLLQIEKQGTQNADLYNNIGICYYHLNQTGVATVYFLRALNLKSDHPDAKNNLDFVMDLSKDKALYPQRAFLVQFFFRWYDFLNINRFALLALFLLLLFALSVHWTIHYDREKELGLPVLFTLISAILLFTCTVMLFTKYNRMRHNSKAVIISSESDGYSGAGTQYNKLFSASEGLIVHIQKESGEWSLILLPNGVSGWIRKTELLRVVPK